MKLRPYTVYRDGQPTVEITGYHHWCPACDEPHGISVQPGRRPIWTFNGDLEHPTFHPSIRCFTTEHGKQITLCHYFITDGMIVFCNDNPHALNGRTVELPDYPQA